MLGCPNCGARLSRRRISTGIVFDCSSCGGRVIGLGVLRNSNISSTFLDQLWLDAINQPESKSKPCPYCRRFMKGVKIITHGIPLELDVCNNCQEVWFDPREFEALPEKSSSISGWATSKEPIIYHPDLDKNIMDSMELGEFISQKPENILHTIPAAFGLPAEINAKKASKLPFVTWILTGLCILIYASVFPQLKTIIPKWGFISSQWSRYVGLTLITSFFLHASLWHLIGNMYFLFIFGDNVEDQLGKWKFLLLIAGSHAVGLATEGIFFPGSTIPCVGASAGIAGIISYYAIAFPKAKIGFLYRLYWFQLPAPFALGLYILLQFLGLMAQKEGGGGVAYLAHLGGLGFGIFVAIIYRYSQSGSRLPSSP